MPTIVAGLNPEAQPLAVPRADELFDEMSEPPMVLGIAAMAGVTEVVELGPRERVDGMVQSVLSGFPHSSGSQQMPESSGVGVARKVFDEMFVRDFVSWGSRFNRNS
ncbi:hypothetical protein Droror1_Dr00026819 [Drosera rotundifolia]